MFEIKYLTNEKGEKTDVILPYSEFMDILEEIEDLRTIAERKDETLIENDKVKQFILENE